MSTYRTSITPKTRFTLTQSLLLLAGLFCIQCSFANTQSLGITPHKRAQSFEWMSIAQWDKYHAEDVLIAQHDSVDVLFIGDSITHGWDWPIWEKNFKPLNAANFAIGGDNTGNVLWRLQQGTIGQLQPKLIVVLIGVNNLGALQETPEQAAEGVRRVITQLNLAWPSSKILLNAVFPYDEKSTSPNRERVAKFNQLIKPLGDEKQIFFRDYSAVLLEKNGDISPKIMADFLHPTPEGYARWAKVMTPDIHALLK